MATTIIINSKAVETNSSTLAEYLDSQQLPQMGVAVAVNNKMVARSQWDSITLTEGMSITILKAFCGG